MRAILKGSTDQSTVVRFLNLDGTPAETVDAGSPGPIGWYSREGGGKILFNTVTLASLTASHSDGGIEHKGGGYYRLDVPDGAWAAGADGVLVSCDYPGLVVVGAYHQLVEFDLSGSEAARLKRALDGTILGTVSNGSSATSLNVNLLDPAASSTNQWQGKILTFARNTTTAGLRGVSTRVSASTPGSPDTTLTVDTLPTSPANGDIFSLS